MDKFEFSPVWTINTRVPALGHPNNTPICVIMGKMVSTVTYLRTTCILNILMTCWLSGERSLPFGLLVLNIILMYLHFVKNTGNISLETCKSGKQTCACALVCLPDLQLSREIFPVFLPKVG